MGTFDGRRLQADRRAGVDAALAEDLVEQFREAVHHLWRLLEAGNAVDHPQHLDHARDPAQIAEYRLGLRQLLDRAQARRLVALLDGVGLADAPAPGLSVPSGRCRSGKVRRLPVITPGAIAGCIDRASGSSIPRSCSFSSGVMRFSLTNRKPD